MNTPRVLRIGNLHLQEVEDLTDHKVCHLRESNLYVSPAIMDSLYDPDTREIALQGMKVVDPDGLPFNLQAFLGPYMVPGVKLDLHHPQPTERNREP